MSLSTRSVFYYGYTVDNTSNTIRINEGSGDVDIELSVGKYSATDYVAMVSREINAALTQDYTVVLDRVTRYITISAPLNFEMKIADIFPLNSGYPIMGFVAEVNQSGSNEYTGDAASGKAYYPQFVLQSYVPLEQYKEFLDASINQTGDGAEEIVSFGLVRYTEFNIKGISDRYYAYGSPVENNPTGVTDAIDFMDYCIEKGAVEFMPNRNVRETYVKIIANKFPGNSKGVGYKLKEDARIVGIYSTGIIKFKEIK